MSKNKILIVDVLWRPGRDLNPALVMWWQPHNVDRATAEHTRPDYTTRAKGANLPKEIHFYLNILGSLSVDSYPSLLCYLRMDRKCT